MTIKTLMTEASQAGDFEQAALCQLALYGEANARTLALLDNEARDRVAGYSQAEARAECERIISEAND